MTDDEGSTTHQSLCPDRGERGMSTAEYAVGTVAAAGFGLVLFELADEVIALVRDLLMLGLQEMPKMGVPV